VLLAIACWTGRDVIARARAAVNQRWTRIVEGPPVPSSAEPKTIEGTIVARALLLHEGIEARDRPGGEPIETIRRRMFADVYDVWPLTGEPDFLRIGNRRPFGWVSSQEALAWNSRLTLKLSRPEVALSSQPEHSESRPISIGPEPLPVLDWNGPSVKVATWKPDQPWEGIDRRGWLDAASISAESWTVLLSREEILALVGSLLGNLNDSQRNDLRYRTILGRLGDTRSLSAAECELIRKWLPAEIRDAHAETPRQAMERLARLNETWTTDASWSGTSFHAVPMNAIP
jgi:hypothetical protein